MTDTNTEPLVHERRALAAGARVQEFEILQLLGGGGFGLAYLAHDQFLGRRVALKEFMPPMASRSPGTTAVTVHFLHDTEAFSAGLSKFLNEARLLARFDHPHLVKVHRVWEENGTAYMAMPFYEGPTLQKAVAEESLQPGEASMRQILLPLLDVLACLHHEQCYHRDISPDNIILTANGPVLLDFGAARMMAASGAQNFTVVLKEGYAPLEQYAGEGQVSRSQGPWTDIYALASVMRYAITGTKPASAVGRVSRRPDPQQPLARMALKGRYSDAFLRTIDAGMALYVEDRPQSIEEFYARLGVSSVRLDALAPSGAARQPVPAALTAVRDAVSRAMARPWPRRVAMAVVPLILLGAAMAIFVRLTRGDPAPPSSPPALVDTNDDAITSTSEAASALTGATQSSSSFEMPPATGEPKQRRLDTDAGTRPPKHPPRPPAPKRELPPPPVTVAVVDPAAIKTSSLPVAEANKEGPSVSAEGKPNRLDDGTKGSEALEVESEASLIEIGFQVQIDRIIKAHSVIAESPEFEPALIKSKGRETVVSFELDRQGRVSEVFVDRPSGSVAQDRMAVRIVSSTHYPPLPKDAWRGQASHVFSVPLKFQKN